MKLELMIDGKKKMFTTNFVSARHFRQLMEYDSKIDYTDLAVEDADELVGFVCEVFNNQFSPDEFYDGIPSHELISTIGDVFYFIRTGETPERVKESDTGK